MNPFEKFVSDYARLFRSGQSLPPVKGSPAKSPKLKPNAPVALVFSPHPDDECIIGALPLRLRREAGFRVTNVAVTLGSKVSRRKARLKELTAACKFLDFELALIAPGGLDHITPVARLDDPKRWQAAVRRTAALIRRRKPAVIFLPHARDWHPAHVGTHWLVMDALATLPVSFRCALVETEFWGMMGTPNLMVESSEADLADLVGALSLHVGEVQRNPYHLRLPVWMQDNVRRGAELVGGAGSAAPDFVFATLYRVSQWAEQAMILFLPSKKMLGQGERPTGIFP